MPLDGFGVCALIDHEAVQVCRMSCILTPSSPAASVAGFQVCLLKFEFRSGDPFRAVNTSESGSAATFSTRWVLSMSRRKAGMTIVRARWFLVVPNFRWPLILTVTQRSRSGSGAHRYVVVGVLRPRPIGVLRMRAGRSGHRMGWR